MENVSFRLAMFIKIAVADDRISRTQLSLFIALLNCWLEQNCNEQFKITRKIVMQQSKIPAISTYHRCLNKLIAFGYIEYKPTFDHYKGSRVKITIK
ncbi:MAG: hypothetical protein NVSMB24_32860 [Mucilaginibacter sp.]